MAVSRLTPERRQRISEVYLQASACPADERASFLEEACGEDDVLRREIESMLEGSAPGGGPRPVPTVPIEPQFGDDLGKATLVGRRFGQYKIEAFLGSGGMGEVYRARDTKLGRQVALKVLSRATSRDPERQARFQREARLLASLNHPHIGAIYGSEERNGIRALVLELVEGESVSERIRRGAMPLNEALTIGRQIAEALEIAHEKGVVHRDLKPANVRITPDGVVKVLDFGLAKAVADDPSNPGFPESSLPTVDQTREGTILGTAGYMSPEQACGGHVEKRTDIWAFGCVLYEMLTGRPAFEGRDVPATIARILQREPDWTLLPSGIPPRVRELLRVCLEKDIKNRRQSAGDVRIDIEQALNPAAAAASDVARPARNAWLPWLIAAGMGAVAMFLALRPTPRPQELRLQIQTQPTTSPLHFAISRDGLRVAFVAGGGAGPERMWLRRLDEAEAQEPLTGVEGAQYPFWSPDGQSVAFFASGRLHRLDLSGGGPQPIATVSSPHGGTWNAEGIILFAPSDAGPIMRLTATGGEPVPVTKVKSPREVGHRLPVFLPDDRHFLFYVAGAADAAGIYLGKLDGGEPRRLMPSDTAGAYVDPGFLLYARQGVLTARRLDVQRGELSGEPMVLAPAISADSAANLSGIATAKNRILYRISTFERRQLNWAGRTGTALGVAGDADPNSMLFPELSPDGRRVAFQRSTQNNVDVWVMDLERGSRIRFTHEAGFDGGPVWSPDGRRVVFVSDRTGSFNLYAAPSSGRGSAGLVLETPNFKWPQHWSKDGKWLLYMEQDPTTGYDLKAFSMTGATRSSVPVATTPFNERHGQISPDGQFVAYATNESGRFEVVVQPFPDATDKLQISTGGGMQPRWSPDGKELFFISLNGTMMSTSFTPAATGLQVGATSELFPTRIVGGGAVTSFARPSYAVAADGRFLINQLAQGFFATPITVILNWKPKKLGS